MSKSESSNEKTVKRPVPIQSAANRPAKIRKYHIIQQDANTVVYMPITAYAAQVDKTKEELEAQTKAILKRIRIESSVPGQTDVWRQLKDVQDFSKGGIIQKNSRIIDEKTLSRLTRKDAYECKVPKVLTSKETFYYEVTHYESKQTITDPFSLGSIPGIDTVRHLLSILQAYKSTDKEFYFVRTSLGMFDKEALEIMVNFHEATSTQNEVDEELYWFSSPHEKPFSLVKYPILESVRKFQNILYKEEIKKVLPNNEMTTDDLASICCGRSLSLKFIKWMIKKLNAMQSGTLCMYVDSYCNHDEDVDVFVDDDTKQYIQSWMAEKDKKPDSLVFILNVNSSSDTTNNLGYHYALCYIDHNEKKILYADSQGLAPHDKFLNIVREYYTIIYDDDIIGFSLSYCHDYRANENEEHTCERGLSCASYYPLHEDVFLSGMVVVVVAAISCLAKDFFDVLTAIEVEGSQKLDVYLTNIELYNGYLRHVLISWLADDAINIDYLVPISILSGTEVEIEAEVSIDAIMLDHGEYADSQNSIADANNTSDATTTSNANTISDVVEEIPVEASQNEASISGSQNGRDRENDRAVHSLINSAKSMTDMSDLDVDMESTESQAKSTKSLSESNESQLQSVESLSESNESQNKSNQSVPKSNESKNQSNESVSESTKSRDKSHESVSESNKSETQNNESFTILESTSVLQETTEEIVIETSQSTEPNRRSRKCPYCDFITCRTYNLRRHVDRFHKNVKKPEDMKECQSGNCLCVECGHRCPRVKDFRIHLANVHQMIFRVEMLEFQDEQEFQEWKNNLENKDLCHFLKNGCNPVKGGEVVTYFSCNHSGFYRPRIIDGSRPDRKLGSFKIGNNCTAGLRVAKKEDSKITVHVCYTHFGHSREFRGTLITLDEKRWIEAKMQDGTREDIFNELRNSLITRRRSTQTTNIMKTIFGVDDVMKQDDDHLSLLNWIVEWDELVGNPVIFYKLKDVEHPALEMEADDFIIVAQSEIQKKMLMQFGQNGICCFSVRCLSYTLTTLIVIDEFDDGFPVASCLSNRIDESTIRIFFSQVQLNVGDLKPAWFACDCNSDFYDIFTEVTNSTPRSLLYLSSMERRFRNELEDIQSITTEVGMYEILMKVLQENSEKAFEDVVVLFMQRKTKKAEKFYSSFQLWLRRKCEWALCYRPTDVDTPAEEMRDWISQRFSDSEVNRRVDTATFNLLCYTRKKWIDRTIKLNKGQNTQNTETIASEHHSLAENMLMNCVKPMEDRDDKYQITDENKTFTIRIRSEKNCHCMLRCVKCSICPHMHYCSCPDSVLNSQVCSHAHLLSRYLYGDKGWNAPDCNQTFMSLGNSKAIQCCREVASNEAEKLSNEAVNSALHSGVTPTSEMRDCDQNITSLKEKAITKLREITKTIQRCENYGLLQIYDDLIDEMKNDFEVSQKK